jgi:hypothetical protein
MVACWQLKPYDRPKFKDIASLLHGYIANSTYHINFALTGDEPNYLNEGFYEERRKGRRPPPPDPDEPPPLLPRMNKK